MAGDRGHMPANNTPSGSVPLGSTKGKSAIMASSGANVGSKHPSKSNMPAHNKANSAPKMGNTKHGVGEVPAYLRGK